MTRYTAYLVRTLEPVGRGFKPGGPWRLDSRRGALSLGERLAGPRLRAEVHAIEVDEAIDYCSEPRLIAAFGLGEG